MKRIGILALERAARNAPAEVGEIAKRELNRQINTSGIENETPELEKVREWIHAEKMARARRKLKH